nr:Mariner Mos1 transposase [Hymenolepis microstoma]
MGGERFLVKTRVKLKKNYQNHWVFIRQQTISKQLKQLRMIEKEGYWSNQEVKLRRDVERRLFACEQLLERQTRKRLLHRIVTGAKNGYTVKTLNYKRSTDEPKLCSRKRKTATDKKVEKYLKTLKWEMLPHPPPYSPDVAPSDFRLTHLPQWHTAWLTSTSARLKK